MKMKWNLALLACALLSLGAQAGTLVNLSAEASLAAANDQVSAIVYAEANGANPADLARQVNQDIGEALKLAKSKPGVTVKTGQQQTFPTYSPNQKIENWRMRSELVLESKDFAGFSELLSKLQQMRLAIRTVSQQPSEATRHTAEDAATQGAIAAFQQRARLVADALGKPYKIKQLNVQQSGGMPRPIPFASAARAMAAEAAPVPMEAGESQVTTVISGEIELGD